MSGLVDAGASFLRRRFCRGQTPRSVSFNWTECGVVLQLPSRSDSLHFRAYAESVGDGSLLDWAVRRSRRATGDASDVYVLVNPTEAGRVEQTMADGTVAALWPGSGRGSLRDLEQLASTKRKARLLLVDLAATVLPLELFERLLRHHLASDSHATSLIGLPCSASPVLVEADLLSTLVRGIPGLPTHVLPPDVRFALAGLERAVQAVGKRAPVRFGRLTPLSADAQARRGWPYAVTLDSLDDVQIFRRVFERCSVSPEAAKACTEPLDCWMEAAREYRETRLATLRPRPRRAQRQTQHSAKRRVLYVQSPSAFTGVEQVLVLLAEGIARGRTRPFECAALIALAGTLTDRLARAGVEVHVAHRDFALNSVEHYLYSLRVLEEMRPAVVHAHSVVGVPFGCAVAERDVPFLQHVHVANERLLRALQDQVALASAVVAVSEFVKQRLIRLAANPEKVHVIHNGVPIAPSGTRNTPSAARDAAAGARTRQACGVPADAPVVVLIARFVANKRHDIALDAFAQLRAQMPGAYLLLAGEAFAGDRPVFEAAERRIERLRLRDRVRFLGFWRDMSALYAASDVLLLPSEDDPLPMTIMEAMAAGVPVVAARSGGTPELIEHGESGVLVEPGHAEGFAAALQQLLTEGEWRRRLVEGALARCRAEFSVSRFVHRIGHLYERTLADEPVVAGEL